MSPCNDPAADASALFTPRTRRVYAAHALASIASNLLIPSFFFYAKQIFGWGSRPSLALVAGEGFFYMAGALLADRLAARLGRRHGVVLIQAILVLLAAVAWIDPAPILVVAVLLAYTFVSAAGWPILESLIAAGAGAAVLSRRIGVYNLVWSSAGALMLAVSGFIIVHFPAGMFFIPMAAHLAALAMLFSPAIDPPAAAPAAHAAAEPALMRHRRLALQLSRIGLPAVYIVVYTLVALMPWLRVIQSFTPAAQTVVASLWMAARFLAFLLLGATAWWHTRPRVLLGAIAVMLLAFGGVTLRLADLTGAGGLPVSDLDRFAMIGWQIPLGLSMGMIYTASLYFGMVLSEGSTEHGGYHEALIGLGQVIGPAAALAADRIHPNGSVAAVAAVGGLLLISLVAAGAITARHAISSE
jgi:MFS family permease